MKQICILLGWIVVSMAAPEGVSGQALWTVSETPILEIGSVDGPPFSTFHDIRGAVLAQDSVIVVADGGGREIRVFSRAGDYITSFGRAGDGPAEFQGIGWVDLCGGDTAVVYDFARHRITKWSLGGDLLDGFAVEGPEGDMPPFSVSCGPSGGFAVVGWPDFMSYKGGVGPYRFNVTVGVVDSRGKLERVLGTFPGPERYRYESNDGPRPLGKTTIARMGVEAVYVGTADAFEIRRIDPAGEEQVIGRAFNPRRLEGKLLSDWQSSVIGDARPEARPATRRALEGHQTPETLPAYSDFLLDRLGLIWVAHYGIKGEEVFDWDVFDPAGAYLASLKIPSRFRPTEIGADYLLGVTTDDMGVERVQMYRLSR